MLSTRRKRIRALILFIAAVLALYFVTGVIRSRYLESTQIQLALPSRNGATGTVRIAQVSDLHRAAYGLENQQLVDLVASKKPDIIVATGDMIDINTEDITPTIDLFQRLARIAPTIYSLGNHEIEREDLYDLLMGLTQAGVRVVHNNAVSVYINGQELRIAGLYTAEFLHELDDDGSVDILLCHFPHKLDVFAAYGVPLTFAGHTHGGQFRIPFFDIALYAPNQGWFPDYTTGLYEKEGSYMIVSRGLGNSTFPFRVHNPPEVIIADITYTNQI